MMVYLDFFKIKNACSSWLKSTRVEAFFIEGKKFEVHGHERVLFFSNVLGGIEGSSSSRFFLSNALIAITRLISSWLDASLVPFFFVTKHARLIRDQQRRARPEELTHQKIPSFERGVLQTYIESENKPHFTGGEELCQRCLASSSLDLDLELGKAHH
jgi:hypothetical protein